MGAEPNGRGSWRINRRSIWTINPCHGRRRQIHLELVDASVRILMLIQGNGGQCL
jgi:hypothetical protein